MADDETTDATERANSTEETKPPKERGAGVHVPAWALAALVVVAALAIGGVGYAIGHSGNDSIDRLSPIADVRSAPDHQDNGGSCRGGPMGNRGGRDGDQFGPGPGGGGPMGPLGPGNGPGGPGRDNDHGQNQNGGQHQGQGSDGSSY
jgi:hypothetical protein